MKSKIKLLIFFDLDGTLFEKAIPHHPEWNTGPSIWHLVAETLGKKAVDEENETKRKWTHGEYGKSYVRWMQDTIRIHLKYGLTKDKFKRVIKEHKYHKGVKRAFKELKKKGYITALISGSYKELANRAIKDLKIDHAFIACEYFFDKKGKLYHWNLIPSDYHAKTDFMELLMREYGITPKECAFVGDGKNDIALAKRVGLSIAFNGDPELQKVSTYSINQKKGKEDFREILKYIK